MKEKTVYLFLLSIIAVVFIGYIGYIGNHKTIKADNTAKDGKFTIRDLPEKEIIPLNGEWDFYWKELYNPRDFKDSTIQANKYSANIPNPWGSYTIEERTLPKTGYATYRLIIELPASEIGKVKSIYIPNASSAYTLWIDGEEKAVVGRVGKTHRTMQPGSIPRTASFVVQSNTVELIIQVSNFFQRKAGLFEPIYIGEPEAIMKYQESSLFYRSMVIVSLLLMGLYHLTLFAFRKKELQFIFFGIVCLIVGVRAILINRGLVPYILPFLNWEMANKIEYLGATLGIMFFSLFTYTQFTEDMNRKLRNVIIIVFSLYSLFIIAVPSIVYTKIMVFLQILVMLTFMYLMYVYLKALIKRRLFALLNSIAVGILVMTAVNDVLYFNNLIPTTELTSVGLLFFMFTEAIIIAKRYSLSFLDTEKLTHELAYLNASLEQQIQERTIALQQTNKELQVANQKLNDANLSRRKWIRNISHEIASPLTSIRSYTKGMLDGIIQSEKKYIQLVYDQSVHLSDLLEDLNDMTDMENNQIKFNLQKVDIHQYMEGLFNKYKLEIEKEGIIFEYRNLLPNRAEGYFVLIDKMRMEQVIVNLLKNAQRFVNENGKMTLGLRQFHEKNIMISVKDNGVGLPNDELELVFSRFYKGRTQGKPHNGSGLGLPISKEIIDYHQGEFFVKSKVGEGTCFYFTLPLE